MSRAATATFLARALGLVEIPARADPTGPTAPDPSACRPPGTPYTTAGFPRPEMAAPSIGRMRVAVLFIDFPDAVADYRTQDEAALGLPYAEAYLEAASYGRLDVEFVPLHGWLRAEHNFDEYLEEVPFGEMRVFASAEAIRLADPSFDFTGIHSVMTVLPSSRFGAGDHTLGSAHTDEGEMTLMAGINTVPLDEPPRPRAVGLRRGARAGPQPGPVGPLPLRRRPPTNARMRRRERIWVRSEFGLMGLNTAFLTHPGDHRIEITGRYTYGRRVTGYTFQLEAAEMLAWSRWQLGWLDESQVLCLTADRSRVRLSPVADPGDAAVMAAVPLSDTEVLVVEVRVKVGYDAEQEEHHDDGALITIPALATEGGAGVHRGRFAGLGRAAPGDRRRQRQRAGGRLPDPHPGRPGGGAGLQDRVRVGPGRLHRRDLQDRQLTDRRLTDRRLTDRRLTDRWLTAGSGVPGPLRA